MIKWVKIDCGKTKFLIKRKVVTLSSKLFDEFYFILYIGDKYGSDWDFVEQFKNTDDAIRMVENYYTVLNKEIKTY